jgi:CHAD domain-containing protein
MRIPIRSYSESDTRLTILRDSWSALQNTLPPLTQEVDTDRIHDARVAARRLRALLRSMRPEVNPLAYAQLKFDLTNLGRDLANARTVDVRGRLIESLLAIHPQPNLHDHRGLRKLLERMVETTRKRLVRRVNDNVWQSRITRLRETAAGDELLLHAIREPEDDIRTMLADSIDAASRALRRRKTNLRSLHQQRIRIKCARYVSEALLPRLGSKGRGALSELREAQDILGEIRDLAELVAWLRNFAVPTPLHELLIQRATKLYDKRVKRYVRATPSIKKTLRKILKQTRKTSGIH